MTSPTTVVVGVDFSAGSDAALARAALLAERAGAALHIVHAGDAADDAAETRARLAGAVRDALGTADARVGAGVPTLALATGRNVPQALAAYAARVRADVLVVGTHGRSGLDRLLAGSVAEACVAMAPCAVLTVPPGGEAPEPSAAAPVLVAVDFSEVSRLAVAAGRTLATLHGAPLELLHVVREAGAYAGLVPSALTLAGLDDELDRATRRRLAGFGAAAAPAAVHVALGPPSRLVAALARARGAGLIVMGAHSRAGATLALLGSTAAATIQRSPCAVLTVRRPPPPPRAWEAPGRSRAVA